LRPSDPPWTTKRQVRVLYVDDILPVAAIGYGYPRSAHIVRQLIRLGVELMCLSIDSPRKRVADKLDAIAQDLGCNHLRLSPETAAAYIGQRIGQFDILWVSRLRNLRAVLPGLRRVPSRCTLIYDAECLTFRREHLRHQFVGSGAGDVVAIELERAELDLIKSADLIVSVNETEAGIIHRRCGRPVTVIGHCHKQQNIPHDYRGKYVGFLGSFHSAYTPNVDAVCYLLREILPIVLTRQNIEFMIAGYRSLVLKRLLPTKAIKTSGITFAEFEDVREFYEACRLVVIPTRFASGTPWKLTEALSHGIPCVTNRLIAQQLDVWRPPVLVADSPEEYADRIYTLYHDQDKWLEVSRQGACYAENMCSEAISRVRLRNLLEAAVS
jgi:O-antigen biosynthesis protein